MKAGLFFATYSVSVTIVRLFLSDLISTNKLFIKVLIMLAFFSISIFFLPFTENITHVIIFAVIFSSTYALIYPFISSLLVQPGNENSSGRLFGALNATFGIGVHLMTFVFGYVIQYFGYARGFQTCSLFILIFTMIILIKEVRSDA